MDLLESSLPRNLLERIAEREKRESSSGKKFDPYLELNLIGIPIEKRREIVDEVYGFVGTIILKPKVFKNALRKIKEERLYGEDALKMLKSDINLPYVTQAQTEILGN